MNILITGGSGVIGSKLIPLLLEENKLIAIGRELKHFPEYIRHHKNFKFYEIDLFSGDILKITDRVDFIVHLAALVSDHYHTHDEYFALNFEGTKKLIQFARKNNVKNFFFTSSVSVYGESLSNRKLTEKSRLTGKTDYALSKIEAEKALVNSGLNYVIFRVASVYGPGSKGFINKIIKLTSRGVVPFPIGKEYKKSFIYIDDLVEYVIRTLREPKLGIYNISHPDVVSYVELLELIKLTINKKYVLKLYINKIVMFIVKIFNKILHLSKVTKNPRKINLDPLLNQIVVSPNLAIKEFEYSPVTDIQKGIELTLESLKKGKILH